MDVLFINPGNSSKIYQGLSNKYAAVETPTWSLLLANSMRKFGYECGLVDVNAENIESLEVYERIKKYKPRLVCFVVYGQNVNAGTTNMSGATYLSNFIKKQDHNIKIAYIGSHVQALPKETLLNEESIDFVFTNEGVYALRNILGLNNLENNKIKHIKGIAYRENDNVVINFPEEIVPAERMDTDLPGYAWDLLPMKKKPFDL